MGRLCLLLAGLFLAGSPMIWAAEIKTPLKEKAIFQPIDDQKETAERYRLDKYEYEYELKLKKELPISGYEIHTLTFPSPVKSPHPENNIVHCEYYKPRGKGPFPAVVVLDILGGDQSLSRGICSVLAQNNICGLFVQMAYYGPRKPEKGDERLLSPDVEKSLERVRQTVLDVRVAGSWLETRPEIDPKKIGILGTSLGSFMSGLTAAAEPRFQRVGILLGGGGLVDAYWDHPQAKPYIEKLIKSGGDKETAKKIIGPGDPLTYADSLKKRKILMVAASNDEVVPPSAAKALWEATGKQEIIWVKATHTGAALYVFDVSDKIIKHFKE